MSLLARARQCLFRRTATMLSPRSTTEKIVIAGNGRAATLTTSCRNFFAMPDPKTNVSNPNPRDKTTPAGVATPPGFQADPICPITFDISSDILTATSFPMSTSITKSSSGSNSNVTLARAIISALRRDGIVQLAMDPQQYNLWLAARAASARFFCGLSPRAKAACVSPTSYAGYIASGEEVTAGVADYSEVFTITPDLDARDPRVLAGWPCHGPCPWPEGGGDNQGKGELKEVMGMFMERMREEGEKVLSLVEIGLGVEEGALRRYTRDGWHHMRVLRFPARNNTNGKGKAGRGIGSHTDYGLLVLSAQDEVGGLFIRRPSQDEDVANWKTSAAGVKEDDNGWLYVPPVDGVHTLILGDMMQYLTRGYLKATLHKVGLNTRERYAIAYFHEPSFQAVLKPLVGGCGGVAPEVGESAGEGIHYGTHFTNMFMRNYPDRVTTRRLIAEGRYRLLETPELRTMGAVPA